jgi:hypothetical protein
MGRHRAADLSARDLRLHDHFRNALRAARRTALARHPSRSGRAPRQQRYLTGLMLIGDRPTFAVLAKSSPFPPLRRDVKMGHARFHVLLTRQPRVGANALTSSFEPRRTVTIHFTMRCSRTKASSARRACSGAIIRDRVSAFRAGGAGR